MIHRDHLWQALRIFLACAIAYGGSVAVGFKEGYWALITAVVVTQPILGDTLSASRDRIVGTLIGAVTGLAVILAVTYGGPEGILFWVALAPLAMLTAIRPNRRLACITLAIVVLVPSSGPPFARPIDRVLEIMLGTAASIAVALVIAPRASAPTTGDTP